MDKGAKMSIRDRLAIIYLPFMLLWFGFVAWIASSVDLNTLEALGIGTATGIFLACFKDMWQFYFRKKES